MKLSEMPLVRLRSCGAHGKRRAAALTVVFVSLQAVCGVAPALSTRRVPRVEWMGRRSRHLLQRHAQQQGKQLTLVWALASQHHRRTRLTRLIHSPVGMGQLAMRTAHPRMPAAMPHRE
jgi:hypothetical protein